MCGECIKNTLYWSSPYYREAGCWCPANDFGDNASCCASTQIYSAPFDVQSTHRFLRFGSSRIVCLVCFAAISIFLIVFASPLILVMVLRPWYSLNVKINLHYTIPKLWICWVCALCRPTARRRWATQKKKKKCEKVTTMLYVIRGYDGYERCWLWRSSLNLSRLRTHFVCRCAIDRAVWSATAHRIGFFRLLNYWMHRDLMPPILLTYRQWRRGAVKVALCTIHNASWRMIADGGLDRMHHACNLINFRTNSFIIIAATALNECALLPSLRSRRTRAEKKKQFRFSKLRKRK